MNACPSAPQGTRGPALCAPAGTALAGADEAPDVHRDGFWVMKGNEEVYRWLWPRQNSCPRQSTTETAVEAVPDRAPKRNSISHSRSPLGRVRSRGRIRVWVAGRPWALSVAPAHFVQGGVIFRFTCGLRGAQFVCVTPETKNYSDPANS